MDKASLAREQMNTISDVKISMNDLIIKAAAAALRKNQISTRVGWEPKLDTITTFISALLWQLKMVCWYL